MDPSSPSFPPRPPSPRRRFFLSVWLALVAVGATVAGLSTSGPGSAAIEQVAGWSGTALHARPAMEPAMDLAGDAGSLGAGPVATQVDEPVSPTRVAQVVAPALVNIDTVIGFRGATSAGTGIVLSSDGVVLTNNHVINGATSIKATNIGNGRTYQATVVGYDRGHDIAVLRLRGASGLRTAKIGDSNRLRVGDQVAAVGNAGGAGGRPKMAAGRVTALDQTVSPRDELTGSVERLTGLIEVAANVEPGDSGGPLVNTAGEVIGVDTAASANYQYSAAGGTGYAIPINSALAVARQIEAGANTDSVHTGPTGMLGVTVTSSNQFGPGTDAFRSRGVLVAGVQRNSPAWRAGLATGDTILAFDGYAVDSATTLTNLVVRHHPGDRVEVIWAGEDGQRHSASVVLVEGPPA